MGFHFEKLVQLYRFVFLKSLAIVFPQLLEARRYLNIKMLKSPLAIHIRYKALSFESLRLQEVWF